MAAAGSTIRFTCGWAGSLVVLCALAVSGTSAKAATFDVDATHDEVDADPGDGQCSTAAGGCTLRAAFMEANALGSIDVIRLPSGTYTLTLAGAGEDLAVTGDLDVWGSLHLIGAGADSTLVRADAAFGDRLMDIPGGGSLQMGRVTLTGGRESLEGGGAIRASGFLYLGECEFRDNRTTTRGGAILVEGGRSDVVGCSFIDNAADWGGALYLLDCVGGLELTLVEGNSARVGGGACYATTSRFAFSANRCQFRGNVATESAGALKCDSDAVYLFEVTFEDNVAPTVGGVDIEARSVTTRSILHRCVIRANASNRDGPGGLRVRGGVTVEQCEITGNVSPTRGAGLRASGDVQVRATTISRNTSAADGGGLHVYQAGPFFSVVNSTITGNVAALDGGGVFVEESALRLYNTTIADNRSLRGTGGGLRNEDAPLSPVECWNTIIAGNHVSATGADCTGELLSHGHVLIEDPATCVITGALSTTQTNVDPLLEPLASNGGPTPTHRLLPGSPAIDAGNPAGCVVGASALAEDQRGVPRPLDGDADGVARCDIGAVEAFAPTGLAIHRSIRLDGVAPAPAVASAFDAACREPAWSVCPEVVLPGVLEGARLANELPRLLPSLWFYEHSDAVQTMKLERSGGDLVFHAN